MDGDIPGAQAILAEAFKANEDSESIFLAAAKLASETGEMQAAQQILEKARAQADTDRVSCGCARASRLPPPRLLMKCIQKLIIDNRFG